MTRSHDWDKSESYQRRMCFRFLRFPGNHMSKRHLGSGPGGPGGARRTWRSSGTYILPLLPLLSSYFASLTVHGLLFTAVVFLAPRFTFPSTVCIDHDLFIFQIPPWTSSSPCSPNQNQPLCNFTSPTPTYAASKCTNGQDHGYQMDRIPTLRFRIRSRHGFSCQRRLSRILPLRVLRLTSTHLLLL